LKKKVYAVTECAVGDTAEAIIADAKIFCTLPNKSPEEVYNRKQVRDGAVIIGKNIRPTSAFVACHADGMQ
jgi:hypothetical protein